MRLQKVTFKNYKQHKSLELDVDANVVAIIGRNGEGKSNAIGGIQFALTGEQPGFTKQELTTWGAKTGSVTLEFKHNGTNFILERATGAGATTLDYADKHINGISAVNSELLSLVGVDPDITKQSVFVNQAQIDAVLFSAPADRELAFQKLVGIGNAAKINEALGARISALAKPQDYSVIIATLTSELDAWTKLLTASNIEKKDRTAKLNALGITDVAEEQQFLETLKATQAAVLKYKEAAYKAGLAKATYDAAIAEPLMPVPATDDNAYVTTKAAYDLAVMEDQSLQLLGRQLAEYQNLTARHVEAEKIMAQANAEEPTLRTGQAELQAMRETIVAKQGQAASYAGELTSLNDLAAAAAKGVTGECPLCGSRGVTISPAQVQRRMELTSHIQAVNSDITVLQRNANNLQRELDAIAARISRASTGLEIAAKQLAGCTNVEILKDSVLCMRHIQHGAEQLIKTKAAYDVAVQEKAGKDASIRYNAELQSRQARAKSAYDTVNATAVALYTEDVKEAIASGLDIQTVIDANYQKLRDYDALRCAIVSSDTNIGIYTTKCADCNKALADTLKKRDDDAGYIKKLETLNTVRNWFHYKNGPHAVVVDVMKRLTPNVNFFLAKLAAPFMVVADYDTVGFKYMMTNGTVNPEELPTAKSLSGAQKNMLALAFRLSCYCMFSSKLGILVLDEPTAHLDNDNVGKFGELLQRLQVMAREMNLQILVVTHHAEILPFCDKTIVIGAKPEQETSE